MIILKACWLKKDEKNIDATMFNYINIVFNKYYLIYTITCSFLYAQGLPQSSLLHCNLYV